MRYQDAEAVIEIPTGVFDCWKCPIETTKLVQAWIEIRSEDLMVDWQLAVNGDEPFRIAPLQ